MGVVLYEMLALVQPFTASNVAALPLRQLLELRELSTMDGDDDAIASHDRIMKIVNAEPAPLPDSCREEVRDVSWLPFLWSLQRFVLAALALEDSELWRVCNRRAPAWVCPKVSD